MNILVLKSPILNILYLFTIIISSISLLLGVILFSCEGGKQGAEEESNRPREARKNYLEEMLYDGQAIIWHLFHSAFAVKTANHLMIFDYYYDEPDVEGERCLWSGVIEPNEISNQNVMVFISHAHNDHFFPDCFKWKETVKNIYYIVSPEVSQADNRFVEQKGLVTSIRPGQKIEIAGVIITTLESNDSGVAFLLKTDGLTMYHSGDLACWNWDKDKDAEAEFVNKNLHSLKGEKIDIAFHVAEPLLSEAGWGGILAFANAFKPKMLVPMHLRGNYYVYSQINEQLKNRRIAVPLWRIRSRGECIQYKNGSMIVLSQIIEK